MVRILSNALHEGNETSSKNKINTTNPYIRETVDGSGTIKDAKIAQKSGEVGVEFTEFYGSPTVGFVDKNSKVLYGYRKGKDGKNVKTDKIQIIKYKGNTNTATEDWSGTIKLEHTTNADEIILNGRDKTEILSNNLQLTNIPYDNNFHSILGEQNKKTVRVAKDFLEPTRFIIRDETNSTAILRFKEEKGGKYYYDIEIDLGEEGIPEQINSLVNFPGGVIDRSVLLDVNLITGIIYPQGGAIAFDNNDITGNLYASSYVHELSRYRSVKGVINTQGDKINHLYAEFDRKNTLYHLAKTNQGLLIKKGANLIEIKRKITYPIISDITLHRAGDEPSSFNAQDRVKWTVYLKISK